MKKLIKLIVILFAAITVNAQQYPDFVEPGHLFYKVKSDSLTYELKSGFIMNDSCLIHIPNWISSWEEITSNKVVINVMYQVFESEAQYDLHPNSGRSCLQIGRLRFEVSLAQSNLLLFIENLIKDRIATALNVSTSEITRITK